MCSYRKYSHFGRYHSDSRCVNSKNRCLNHIKIAVFDVKNTFFPSFFNLTQPVWHLHRPLAWSNDIPNINKVRTNVLEKEFPGSQFLVAVYGCLCVCYYISEMAVFLHKITLEVQ